MPMHLSLFGWKVDVRVLLLIAVVYFILVGHTLGGASNYTLLEGMDMMKKGQKVPLLDMSSLQPSVSGVSASAKTSGASSGKEGFAGLNVPEVDTSTWGLPGGTRAQGYESNASAELPEGEMFMFANTPFKPECCPNTYSNSSGCACMSNKQYDALTTRYGNNVPFSEY